MPSGPLAGLRVLDLSRVLAGPYCSMLLADMGAEVIKIEEPGTGDVTRTWGPPFVKGESSYFLSINRNKKSVVVDLKSEKGKEIIHRLTKISGVVLENFRPGVAEELSLGYEDLSKINPSIVYCSISGYGQDGPYRDRPAYDIIFQGMSGLMGITGEEKGPPVRIGVAVADIGAGMFAAIGILGALYCRERTGKAQLVDVSILDGQVSWMTYMAHYYFATEQPPKRMGSRHPNISPYQVVRTEDGYLIIAAANQKFWRKLCQVLEKKHLANDPRFLTNEKRVENRDELDVILEEAFAKMRRDEWLKLLMKGGVPCGPVYSMDEVFRDPQVIHREMLVKIRHPKLGEIEQIGVPIKFLSTPGRVEMAPPLKGQHTDEVLKQLGYTKQEIEDFRREGVVE